MPYTRTGPATVNILAPTPITYPSDLYSIAGDTIELAKPVMGIKEPAPANFPILLNIFNPVRNALKNTRIIETMVYAFVSSIPRVLQNSNIICPSAHINPPTQKALKQFFIIGELGVLLSTYD